MKADALVIGAGHNGLVTAAYLAKAGLAVTIVERREVIGGTTVTEEVLPGFRASSCAFVLGLFRPRILRELELRRHGLELFASPDAQLTAVFEDGQNFTVWAHLDRTLREIEQRCGRRDAVAFLRFGRMLQRIGDLYEPLVDIAPVSFAEVRARFERAGLAEPFTRFFSGSVRDLTDAYFESDRLQGLVGFSAIVSSHGGPRDPGTAYTLTHHSLGSFDGSFGKWGFVRGGMGGLADALSSCARAAGVQIRTDAEVQRVIVEADHACGVVLSDGTELTAPVVVSTAEPTRTLLGLVGADRLPTDTIERMRAFRTEGSMARVFVAIDELPQFVGFGKHNGAVSPEHRGHIFLGPSMAGYEAAWEAAQRGELPEDFTIEARIETAMDPQLAPAGRHMIVCGVQQLPRQLAGRTWDQARSELQGRVVARLIGYAPNLEGRISGVASITPLDLERDWSLTSGNIYHGAMDSMQLFDARPLLNVAPYRTPIDGLYLGGAGTHPGGGVMGAAGRNAAMAILADLQLADHDGALPQIAHQGQLLDALLAAGISAGLLLDVAKRPRLRPLVARLTRRTG